MKRYILSIVLFLTAWYNISHTQSNIDIEKAHAYNSFNEMFAKAGETDTALLNILGQIYRELPVKTAQDEKVKKDMAERFQAKFHMPIDTFPLRASGFFVKDKYKSIVEKILKQNLEILPNIIKHAESSPDEKAAIINNAFISLSDAFHTYESLAGEQQELLLEAKKQLDALQSKYPDLNDVEKKIEEKFNIAYIYRGSSDNLQTIFEASPVGDLAGYILDAYSKFLQRTPPTHGHIHFENDINPIIGLNSIMKIAFWLMQYELLKKPQALAQKLKNFDERLNEEAIPLVHFYQTSLSRQEYRNVLEVAEKTLASQIKNILESKNPLCFMGECLNIQSSLEFLIYYLVRYASLEGFTDTLLIKKALEHIKHMLTTQSQTQKISTSLVPFANSLDQLIERLRDEARRHTPS